MKLDNRKPTKTKHKIIASQTSIDEIHRFFGLYFNYGNACKDLGISNVWAWHLCNGHYRIKAKYAEKMVQLSGGFINYERLMSQDENNDKK